jgi:hypothetical protein
VDICENVVHFLYVIKVLECIDQPKRYIASKTSEALHQKRVLLMVNYFPLRVTTLEKQKTEKALKYGNKIKLIHVK